MTTGILLQKFSSEKNKQKPPDICEIFPKHYKYVYVIVASCNFDGNFNDKNVFILIYCHSHKIYENGLLSCFYGGFYIKFTTRIISPLSFT